MVKPKREGQTAATTWGGGSASTWETYTTGSGPNVETLSAPTLTIVAHPNPARVGDLAWMGAMLEGEPVGVARLMPLFESPGGPPAPLDDPFLSRKPTRLRLNARGGLEVTPAEGGAKVRVDGQPVDSGVTLEPEALARGVAVELGRRILLLVRWRERPSRQPPGDLGMIGTSQGLERVRERVVDAAALDIPLLIRGETGVGKELVARAIHASSERAERDFVAVNMAAVPTTLAAAELFGHTRGAFSGAQEASPGYFGRAEGGTLFLDEVGDTPRDLQPAMLRALEAGEIQPVGSHRPKKADVRVVAATDAALETAVEAGRFRAPLYHRLAGYELWVPPLRDRPEDIGALLVHFLAEELDAFGEADKLDARTTKMPWLSAEVVRRLLLGSWEGNVRQLRNVARQLVISHRRRERVRWDPDLDRLVGGIEPTGASGVSPPTSAVPDVSRRPSEISEDDLLEALQANAFKLGPTAKALGIARNSLNALIERSDSVRRPRDLEADEIEAALAEAAGDLKRAAAALGVSSQGLKLRMNSLDMAR